MACIGSSRIVWTNLLNFLRGRPPWSPGVHPCWAHVHPKYFMRVDTSLYKVSHWMCFGFSFSEELASLDNAPACLFSDRGMWVVEKYFNSFITSCTRRAYDAMATTNINNIYPILRNGFPKKGEIGQGLSLLALQTKSDPFIRVGGF